MPELLAPTAGRLCVATPNLEDPNFAGAVVLLLEHTDEGSAGLVLNRPSPLALTDVMSRQPAEGPGWDTVATTPGVVFLGGPVQPDAIVALVRRDDVPTQSDSDWQMLLDDVGILSLDGDRDDVIAVVRDLRLFAGYAGWGPDQLPDEIAEGAWFVVDATAEDVFVDQIDDLWPTVLRRQGGLFTTATAEPMMN